MNSYINNNIGNRFRQYFGSLSTYQRVSTTEGNNYQSTMDTIQQMIAIAHSSSQHPLVVSLINTLPNILPLRCNQKNVVDTLFKFVKEKVRFKDDDRVVYECIDPNISAELLIRPEVLLSMENPGGDCDDFSMLLVSLLLATNEALDIYYVTVAADATQPQNFSHVYAGVVINTPYDDEPIFYPLDASHGPFPGWETPNWIRKKYWLVNKGNERAKVIWDGIVEREF